LWKATHSILKTNIEEAQAYPFIDYAVANGLLQGLLQEEEPKIQDFGMVEGE
jgi:hypothetical protein